VLPLRSFEKKSRLLGSKKKSSLFFANVHTPPVGGVSVLLFRGVSKDCRGFMDPHRGGVEKSLTGVTR